MSEENKALARRFYEEVFNKKDLDAMDQICAADIVDHNAMPGQAPGVQGLKDFFSMFLVQGFPDARADVEEMVAEGDIVVTRFSLTGTHQGELMGAPATGKRVTFHGIDMLRITGGKVTDAWHQGDEMMALAQLGVNLPG